MAVAGPFSDNHDPRRKWPHVLGRSQTTSVRAPVGSGHEDHGHRHHENQADSDCSQAPEPDTSTEPTRRLDAVWTLGVGRRHDSKHAPWSNE